jgi:hypothetical protein
MGRIAAGLGNIAGEASLRPDAQLHGNRRRSARSMPVRRAFGFRVVQGLRQIVKPAARIAAAVIEKLQMMSHDVVALRHQSVF